MGPLKREFALYTLEGLGNVANLITAYEESQ